MFINITIIIYYIIITNEIILFINIAITILYVNF